jgi:7,8-dihydroneopterin aldolase/epimerase/oxygenase
MLTVSLQNLRFYAHHGIFEEEKIAGTWFRINVKVQCEINQNIISLNQTVDYGAIFKIVQKAMQQPQDLLESLAQTMAGTIFATYPIVQSVSIQIIKEQAPIANLNGEVSIEWTQKR